jgi:hypothetical protein
MVLATPSGNILRNAALEKDNVYKKTVLYNLYEKGRIIEKGK